MRKHGTTVSRVFKIRAMRLSPFVGWTLFLDNDANLMTVLSFEFITRAVDQIVAMNASIAAARDPHGNGYRAVTEDPGTSTCPPATPVFIGNPKHWTTRVTRELNTGTILFDAHDRHLNHFFLRWEHYVASGDALNPVADRDQLAFVHAFAETLPTWVDLLHLGFKDPRACAELCVKAWNKFKRGCPVSCAVSHNRDVSERGPDPPGPWGPVFSCANLTLDTLRL